LAIWIIIFWITAASVIPAEDDFRNFTSSTTVTSTVVMTSTTSTPAPLVDPAVFELPANSSIDYDIGHIFG
jgi:hypothetical protein